MDTKKTIRALLEKFRNDQCTEAELKQLREYVISDAYRADIEEVFGESLLRNIPMAFFDDPKVQDALGRVYERISAAPGKGQVAYRNKRFWKKWTPIAAVGLILPLVGLFWYVFQGRHADKANVAASESTYINDIQPGGNRALLTLEDGRTINLSAEYEGIIVGEEITYKDGGTVSDGQAKQPPSSQIIQLATPKGGTYQITLPDGTEVWLNAGSILKYPRTFEGKERVVELVGEAYFSVKKQQRSPKGSYAGLYDIPFKVVTSGQIVTVLGTEFNISAYEDDFHTKTVLVEGTVEVLNKMSEQVNRLEPGTRSIVQRSETTIGKVDVENEIAWKRGAFVFDDTELREAMKQLSRWYNVAIEYQGDIPVTHFFGEISRQKPLSQVVNILRKSKVNFKVDVAMNKLIVYPGG